MDNGRRFIVYRSLIHQERFDLLLEVDDAMRWWTATHGIPIDPKARRIAIEQPAVHEVGRKSGGRPAALPRTGEPVSVWDAGEWCSAGDAWI
ncbi:DNA polymerase ligase N-terminal domain-containing protein [Achromobacter xylosoxidans]|uniref:DNA polymerase ligase N-terminal domain-containing protein n=1 Tax=Achromobacter sp. GbtcB20 TaxID=2824765 RepID=UPI00126695FF